ncbi:MAG: hypothetical protein IJ092_10215 [Atopobiaceae bacterium]|nr:hypothetical protein [Atopobiaceae bacterium]
MSMISAQCDELREVAYKVDEYQMGRERVPLKTAAIMREAADTIWELRESVYRERAEADSLREERDMYRDLVGMMDHPDLNAQLQAENDKLRELLRAAWRCVHSGLSCSDCRLVAGGCTLQSAMRELGIEVD